MESRILWVIEERSPEFPEWCATDNEPPFPTRAAARSELLSLKATDSRYFDANREFRLVQYRAVRVCGFPETRRAWGDLTNNLRVYAGESLIWWGYRILPPGPATDELVLFLAGWLQRSMARMRRGVRVG